MSGDSEAMETPIRNRDQLKLSWDLFERVFVVLLAGYALLGRGFAYLHITLGVPIYVGEIVLFLGVIRMLRRRPAVIHILTDRSVRWYLVFAFLGLLYTIPDFFVYGIDALRDAAVWYYGIYMVIVASTLIEPSRLSAVVSLFGKFAWGIIFAVPLLWIASSYYPAQLASLTAIGEDMFVPKPGDQAVLLTACLLYFLMIDQQQTKWGGKVRKLGSALSALCLLLPLSLSRGGLLGTVFGVVAAYTIHPAKRVWRVAGAALALALILLVIQVRVRLPLSEREISTEQLRENLVSAFAGEGVEGLVETRTWRLLWWAAIVSDTFQGPYFLVGRGFGPNLADEYGFTGGSDVAPLRSPHSVHMTILARMGVPGLVLWLTFLFVYYLTMRHAITRMHKAGDYFGTSTICWLVGVWVAMLVNASFDVYLEGPQGAILYWSLAGFGLVFATKRYVSSPETLQRNGC